MYFIIIAFLSLTLIYGLFGLRIIHPVVLKRRWEKILWLVLILCFIAVPLSMIFRFSLTKHPAAIPLSWFAYFTLGFFTLAFPCIVLRDGLILISRLVNRLAIFITRFIKRDIKLFKPTFAGSTGSAEVDSAQDKQKADDFSRRLFLLNSSNIALVGITSAMTGYGFVKARQVPDIVNVNIKLNNLPPEFNGFRILQLTDLHVSMTIRRDYVKAVVDRANEQEPDMIVFTGDLADGHVNDLRNETEPLAHLKANFGKFFVTGNHEYYAGVEEWLAELIQLGFTPLINEHRIIKKDSRKDSAGIVLSGITDYRAQNFVPGHASNPKAALKGAPKKLTSIMLAHQPKSIFKAALEKPDLFICGHTHGGQYMPWNYMVPLDQPYVHGLHKHDSTLVYVSRGTGYWGPPVRIGAASEISVLQLNS